MLTETSGLAVFVGATLLLLIVPGPAVLYIVARSLDQGVKAGLASAAGMTVGAAAHVLAAALGVSVILVSSAEAFTVVKYAGAAYLIVLGVRTLLSVKQAEELTTPTSQTLGTIFRQAIVVEVLNPKAALFFFAFLPQFVEPSRGPAAIQIVALGMVFLALALVTDSAYAVAAGRLGGLLRRSPRVIRAQRRAAGATYICLGILTATTSALPD
jgi:threonine/homoserine/homoserine lactone efflux protein